ncbi:MAG: ABC transporter ATP-binding protein [Clostridium sp.]|nr:ABC transporter ATP-binding protein [Clostridium sp.]
MEIDIKSLSKNYGKKQALEDINLNIQEGMFGLLGRNGAGKSTLMKILATVLRKSSGNIKICGIDVEDSSRIRNIIGYLPQDFSMYGNMSAYEALDYIGVLCGINKKTRKEKIPKLLNKVNLENNIKTKVKAMSGGMKRRLGIAQALINDPKVIIVDEPTAGLDPEERVRFRNLLCEMAEERIVILSTHIVGDIEATCENIAIMDEGNIIFKGTVFELLEIARGKIYEAVISKLELQEVKNRFNVISMISEGNLVKVRFGAREEISKVIKGAALCEPNIEDSYMYLMNTKRRNN